MKNTWNQIPVDDKKVRDFGIVIFVVVGLLVPAFIAYKNGWVVTDLAQNLTIGSLLFLFVCLFLPKPLYSLYKGWMLMALGMGFVVTRFIITLVYLLLITPIGFIRRQKKGSLYRTFLDFDKNATDSYWIRKSTPYEKSSTEQQF
ncbi:MAG: SxtJ family membrane protein [Balneolales bacterium]|nr:SxtJ family membrane protein [Balneolales bacterium]